MILPEYVTVKEVGRVCAEIGLYDLDIRQPDLQGVHNFFKAAYLE